MTVNFTLTIGNTTHDLSNLVRRDELEIRHILCNSRYQHARDTAVVCLSYDQATAQLIFGATSTIRASLDIDSTPRFRGIVRPTSEYVISDDQSIIRLELIDNFYQLEQPLPDRLVVLNKQIYDGSPTCVLRQLTASTSVVYDAAAPNISTVLTKCYFDKGASILETLADILYYHGYTPYFTADGKLTWRAWSVTSLTPSVNFNDGINGNIRGDAILTRDEISSYDGVEMIYSKIYDVDNALLYESKESFPSTQNGNTILDRMISLGTSLTSARVVDVLDLRAHVKTRSVNFVFSVPVEIKSNQGWLNFISGAVGLGIRFDEAVVQSNKVEAKIKIKADNSGYGGTKLDELRLVGKLRVEEGGFVVRSTPVGSNPEQITAKYLYDQQTAQNWVDAYAKNVVANPYTVKINSYADYPIGAIATVNSTVGNINLTGVITSKTWTHPSKLYTYEVRALSAITPATPTNISLPDTIPTVDDMEELTVGTQEDPLMTVTPQDPVTVTRGLKVSAGGKRMLEMSYAHLSSLALQTSGHSFSGDNFKFDADGNGWYTTGMYQLARITPAYQVTTWTTATINNQIQTVIFMARSLFTRNDAVYLLCGYSGDFYLVDAATRNQIGLSFSSVTTVYQSFFIDGRVWFNIPGDQLVCYSNAWPPTSWGSISGQGFLFPHNGRAHLLTDSKLYRIEGTTLVDIGDYKYDSPYSMLDSIFRKGSITKLKAKEGTTPGILTLDGDTVSFEPTTAAVYTSMAYVAGAYYGLTSGTIRRANDLVVSSSDPTVLTLGGAISLFPWSTGNAELLVAHDISINKLNAYRTVEYKNFIDYSCNFLPVGSVVSYLGLNDPEGWMICDGRAISRTTYATLFNLIGTTFGAGDGVSTFNIPNFRGAFLRGAGSQTIPNDITYTGPNIGQYQMATRIGNVATLAYWIVWMSETDGQTNINTNFHQAGNNTNQARPVYRIRPFNYGVNFIIKVF